MRHVIGKFDVSIGRADTNGRLKVLVPKGAEFLTVALQRGIVCVWMLVDLDAAHFLRTFQWRMTGEVFQDTETSPELDLKYLGTVRLNPDQPDEIVAHLFGEP